MVSPASLVIRLIAAGSLLLPAATAAGGSPFDGVWVADLDTQGGLPADVYLVANGRYACASCAPPRAYPADGRLRPVPGEAGPVSEAVRVAGPRTIVTRILGPALDRTTTMTVSPDGRFATYVSLDRRPGIARTLRTEYLARRTVASPAGAHPVSGTWQGVRYVAVPAELRTTELRLRGERFSYRTPLGESLTALLGSGYVAVRAQGSGPAVRAAVRRVGPRRIEEHVEQDGTLVAVRTFTVAADGRSMEVATADPGGGPTFRVTARRR